MSALELMTELARRGIRLDADGDRLRYHPRSALTPDLLSRLNAQKAELLATLRATPDANGIDRTDAKAVWRAALDRLDADAQFPPDLLQALRAADVRWPSDQTREEPENDPYPEPMYSIDPHDIRSCPNCGTLEQWQNLAGNWRCLHCDPPTKSRQLAVLAERIRCKKSRNNTGHIVQHPVESRHDQETD